MGRSYDFQSEYKRCYYDLLASDEEKTKVRNTLLIMLRSDVYSIQNKTLLAYVCADIGISEAIDDIKGLMMHPSCRDSDKFAFTLALKTLSKKYYC